MDILLADDHTLFRESLAVVLESTFPGSSIASTNSWSEVFDHTESCSYDLLLLDLFMPDISADCWSSSLNRVVNSQKGAVCIISASNNRAHIQNAFHIGVNGYISKTSTLQQMQQALRQIAKGKTYMPEQLLYNNIHLEKNKKPTKLTWRQQETLELLVSGDSNKIIARKLGLAESTVKRHISNTYSMLGAKNRVDAIRITKLQGLLGS